MVKRRGLLLAAAALSTPRLLHAQSWPARPVRVICAYGAGGTADIVARICFNALSERLGQQFVVENRPGAAGTIAGGAVVRAAPDGYTLLYDATSHSVNPALFGARLPYDTERDLLPVFLSMVAPNTINCTASLPFRTVRQFLDYARAQPTGMDAASTGVGSAQHISIALMAEMAGIRLNHVVYRDAPAARNDLAAGRVPLQFGNVPGSVPHLLAGQQQIRVLAHAGLGTIAVLPGVEAIADTLPGYETYEWNGVFAPAGTPPEIIQRLNVELNATVATPAVAERLNTLGAVTRANTVEQMADFRRQQIVLHSGVVQRANIRLD